MLKMNKSFKKVLATLMLVLMLCNTLPISSFAAYITEMNSDAEFGVISGSLSAYNHELHYAKYDGATYIVFCTQRGIKSPNGSTYQYNSDFIVQINNDRAAYKKIAEMIYFGYTMKHGTGLPSSTQAKKDACATQQYVWEYIHNNIDSSLPAPSRDSWNSSYMSSSIYSSWLNEAENNYNTYHNSNVSFNGGSNKVNVGENATFSDTNGVLASYPSFNESVNGVTFKHSQGSNDLKVEVSSNANSGTASFGSNRFRIYRLMPNGESYNSSTMNSYLYFEFESGSIQNLMFSNFVDPNFFSFNIEIQEGKVSLAKTDSTGTKVSGCKFGLYKDERCTQEVATATTDNSGNILFNHLVPGTFYVKELSVPQGYLLNTEFKRVVVENGKTSSVSYQNSEPTGEIRIYKISENGDKVKDAEFTIKAAETIKNVSGSKTFYTQGQVVATIRSNNDGVASQTGLPMGKYEVQEKNAPQGYLLNETVYPANLEYKNSTTPIVEIKIEGVVNHEPTGTISIVKKDTQTGSVPQGDASLENAVYKVYANEDIYNVARTKKFYSKGDLVATRTTDNKGIAQEVNNLPLGHYIVKEETASKGYLLDTQVYDAKLEYKDQYTKVISKAITSNEVVKKQQIHIYKSGIKVQSGLVDGLEGAEFTIKLYSDVQKALNAGYSYEEIWNGIDEYGNSVTVNSTRVAEAQVIAPSYQTVVTDENGNAYTKKLPFGKYITKETKTPKDFFTAEDFTFTISQDESEISEVAQKVKDLFVNNEQMETYVKLVKKDADSGKIVSLTSATFQIKATKDIYDRGNGKIVYKKGEVITQKVGSTVYNSFTTNSKNIVVPDKSYTNKKEDNGTVITPLMLPVGSYEITEIQIPTGYLQLENPVKFTVDGVRDYDKDNEGDYIKEVVVKNAKPFGTLIIDKSIALRENVDTSLIDTSDLSGIQFKFSAKEDVIDPADGSIIYQKGQEIKVYNLDKNGDLKIENIPMGTYEIQEIKTLDGLVLDDTKHEIKFTQRDTITKVYTETRNLVNDTTLTEISKQDITGDKELEGAKLQVIDSDGNVLDEWTSTDKPHYIEGLTVGKEYILRETIAPNGFVKATDIKFRIENTTETHKIKMIDKVVEMTKIDIGGDELEGARIQVFDKDNNLIDEWISSKEPHKINGLTENESYRLHEEVAIEGYVKATDIQFTVTEDKETQKVQMIDKIVEMTKTDIGGNEVEGAEMSVTDENGEVVDSWTSTKEPHHISGLEEGKTYVLHELVAPDGFVKATDVEFTVTEDKETQKVEMIDKVVEMTKTDIGGEELEGAKIQVFDKDNNLVDEWVSSKEPHRINNLVENETYKLHEEVAIEGYVKATDVEFTVTEDKETQKLQMIDKIVEMTKVDIGDKELEGAKIQVFDKDNNLVDEWVSSKEPHRINNLVENETYTLHEEVAIEGYVKATDVEFTVTEDKETQKLQMIDKIVQVTKTDLTNGEELEGAELVVTDEDGNVIDEWTSTKEPHHISGLEEGKTYTLTEKTAPYGYETTESIIFTVTEDKETQAIEMKDMPILKTIRIIKADSSTKEVIKDDFKFGIYEDAECTKLIKEVKSNKEDGTVTFEDLRFGTYYIKESKQPNGYQLSDKVLKLEINDKGVFIDNTEIEEKDEIYSFTFYNELIPKVQTGNEISYILLATLMGLSVIGITTGIVVLKRKNRKDK